jgi:hypothetical protein
MVTDEGGYATEDFRYFFWVFDPSGFAWVGPPAADLAETTCTAPRTDTSGRVLCVPYSVSNGEYLVELDKPVTLQVGPPTGELAKRQLRPIPSVAGTTLDATYAAYSCYLGSCSQGEITFTTAGHYTLVKATIWRQDLGEVFMSTGGGSNESGTYTIGPQSITFTTAAGKTSTVFFFRDDSGSSDTVQIADTWFLKK